MDSRNGKQCRERYVNHLNPDIKRTPWLPEEDDMIEQLYAERGSQWSRFIEKLPGRSDNAIKNRWHLLKRSSKLAATMQGSNPSSVVTLSSIPSSRVDEDQSMKQSSEGSSFDDIKACSKSIDDDAESSSKRTCRRGCDSYNSEGMEVECIGDESLHEWLLDTLSDPLNVTDYLNSCALRDDRNRSNSFDRMMRNGCFDAVMLSDSFFDSIMMWDAGSIQHSEEVFEDFGMHKT